MLLSIQNFLLNWPWLMVLFWYTSAMAHDGDKFIGVDGGGTSCRVALCDRDGKILGTGSSGSANVMTAPETARDNILEACQKALATASVDLSELAKIPTFLGLAGANIGECGNWVKEQLPFRNSIVETDAYISLEGAVGDSDGVVAIIGTGTVFTYRQDGVVRTAGGWGFTVGDLASGAWLGRRLLQESLLSYDGIHKGSALTRTVLEQFENNPQTVVEYAHTAVPGDFGKFAPLIFDYANQRDPIARRIVQRAVADIEETLDVILPDDDARFCMIGGLGPVYANLLSSYYRERISEPLGDAVTGATQLAIKHFGKGAV